MSRRDIVVNTLLGLLLLLIFAVPCVLFVVVLSYLLQGGILAVKHFWPAIPNPPEIAIFGLLLVVSLVSGVRQLRKRDWTGAFLSFVIFPTMLSMWLSHIHTLVGGHASGLAPGAILLVISILPGDRPMTRFKFVTGASLVGATVAVNTDLLGSGALGRLVAGCVVIGIFLRFAIDARENWEPKNPGPRAPLSPTSA
jgi:hypothetical protein